MVVFVSTHFNEKIEDDFWQQGWTEGKKGAENGLKKKEKALEGRGKCSEIMFIKCSTSPRVPLAHPGQTRVNRHCLGHISFLVDRTINE